MRVVKRRRRKGKTDYKARMSLLKSGAPRIAIRKTNKYVIVQYIVSKEAKDTTKVYVNSRELLKYGWPKELKNSLKTIPATYLTGILTGKKINDKNLNVNVILDFGLQREIKGSRIYAVVKGLIDARIKIKCKEDVFPKQERLMGKHMEKNMEKIVEEVKAKIKENKNDKRK